MLTDVPLAIDRDEVLRFQGYKQGVDVPGPAVRALFDEALALGRELMAPRAAIRWMSVARAEPDALEIGISRAETQGVRLEIPGVGRTWGSVEHVAAVVTTIGDALEGRVSALWDARELPLAMMLDSVGSGAVESLAEYVNDLLCQEALPLGLTVTNRISPGYGGWDVAEQPKLLALCPPGAVGVALNEACFMTPAKSITLLAGAGRAARADHYFSQCARCWMRDCTYRRVPARGSVRARL